MKRRISLLLVLTALFITGVAQPPVKYLVKLSDKQNSKYSLQDPGAFLSEQAVARRQQSNISIDYRDLPVSGQYVEAVRNIGYRVTHRIKWLNTLIVEGESPEPLADLPFVSWVKEASHHPDRQTSKPFFEEESTGTPPAAREWSSTNRDDNIYDYGEAFNQIEMLNGHMVHNAGYDGQGMTIAVLDAGFRKVDQMEAFDSLWINEQILGTRNYVNEEDIFNPAISSHGTSVLSTMGGYLPGEIVGTAPKASFWLVRTEDASDEYLLEEYYWVDGAEFADSVGADVINSSLGYTNGFNNPDNNHTYEDMDGNTTPVTIGADIAASKGILVVNSAGNSGSGSWFYIGAPADGDSVMAVGAVDGGGNYVSFSSKGPSYDGRIKPNVAAKGSGATVASEWGGVTYASGTSFSSPIMAGMVASIWQANPSLGNMELITLIQEHGNQASEPDSLLGYGIPDFGAMLDVIGTDDNIVQTAPSARVWPNPFSGELTVTFPAVQEMLSVKVYNANGNIIATSEQEQTASLQLGHLNGLPAGVYIIHIRTPKQTFVRKVVKR